MLMRQSVCPLLGCLVKLQLQGCHIDASGAVQADKTASLPTPSPEVRRVGLSPVSASSMPDAPSRCAPLFRGQLS